MSKVVVDPQQEWICAIGSALMGLRIGMHINGKVVEGESKPALGLALKTAQKMPDHMMRFIGDLIFSEQGRELLPVDLRPTEDEELILWTIRAGALFGAAGKSESTRACRLAMAQRLRRSDVQQVAEILILSIAKIAEEFPGAVPAAFDGQDVALSYDEIVHSLRRLTNQRVVMA